MSDFFHQNNFNMDKPHNLPIIQKLIKAYKLWQNILPNFPRTLRFTFGAKIDEIFLEIIECVFLAARQSQFRERERERE